jgi:hypothetical protein
VVFLFVGQGRGDGAIRRGAEAAGLGQHLIFTGGMPHERIRQGHYEDKFDQTHQFTLL